MREFFTSGMARYFAETKKILMIALFLQGCSTPISQDDWYYCESVCIHTQEACRDFYHGLRCRCLNGALIEVGEPPIEDIYE